MDGWTEGPWPPRASEGSDFHGRCSLALRRARRRGTRGAADGASSRARRGPRAPGARGGEGVALAVEQSETAIRLKGIRGRPRRHEMIGGGENMPYLGTADIQIQNFG